CKLEATAHLTSNFAYLLLFALLFLIGLKQQSSMSLFTDNGISEHLLNFPIFFFGSVSVALFYVMSQKALRPETWLKDILYLPLLLALGIGMSINNAKAVLEAIFNHQSSFVRTPKHGINGSNREEKSTFKKSRYKAIKSLTPFVELAFGFFFTIVVVDNVLNERWIAATLLMPFPVGFFFTSLSSLFQQMPGLWSSPAREKAEK
ncbi:MAG: glycosyl transferase family 2, partial [Akkermansiaceae bacterium]